MDSTLAQDLKVAYVNRTDWEGLEQIARDRLTAELYQQAAGLFDPGTTLDMSNEYHRGVTELVMRFTGTDSDDKDDVAATISGLTLDMRYFASEWARTHGTAVYEGISADINAWAAVEEHRTFSDDELNTILTLLEGAKIVL